MNAEEDEVKGHATMFYDDDPSDDDEIFNQQQPVPTSQQMSTGIQGQPPMEQMQLVQSTMQPTQSNPANSNINFGFDEYDTMLDSDPFDITPSLAFPTHYTSIGWR